LHPDLRPFRQDHRVVGHLLGELSRGTEHENLEPLPGLEAFQGGNHERSRLSGSGLGDTDDIHALEARGDSLSLDGSGLTPSDGFDRCQDLV
jgi:hypothetical protein